MSHFYVGNKFEFPYPFHDQPIMMWEGELQTMATPGCHKQEEEDGSEHGIDIYWTANSEGKIHYEILSIAKMPGKYMDRLIIKKHYSQAGGERFNGGDVIMMTTGKLKGYIERDGVFPKDYEVEIGFVPARPQYQPNF